MSQVTFNSHAEFEKYIGLEIGVSDYLQITQEQINKFAEATLDHQWIHIDQERAKAGPFGTTIAHGQLTLSIMSHLPGGGSIGIPQLPGQKLTINYGFDRVRFISPFLVDVPARATVRLLDVEDKGRGRYLLPCEITVNQQGSDKPHMVAVALVMIVCT